MCSKTSKYVFKFTTQILGNRTRPCTYLRHNIYADTYMEALTTYCEIPAINDLSMSDVGEVKFTAIPNN